MGSNPTPSASCSEKRFLRRPTGRQQRGANTLSGLGGSDASVGGAGTTPSQAARPGQQRRIVFVEVLRQITGSEKRRFDFSAGHARERRPDGRGGHAVELADDQRRSRPISNRRLFASLAVSSMVHSDDPATLIRMVLRGARSVATKDEPTAPAMPAYGWRLDDAQLAAVLTYVCNSWDVTAPAVAAGDVAKAGPPCGCRRISRRVAQRVNDACNSQHHRVYSHRAKLVIRALITTMRHSG